MDQEFRERMARLKAVLDSDDICTAYAASARELEEQFTRIARSLPPEEQQLLTGYRECVKLMRLREHTLVCEKMRFVE